MSDVVVGAWKRPYEYGQHGTLGESLDLDSDQLGWTLRSWKYELEFSGFRGKMILDSPVFGDAARTQIKAFQTARDLPATGVIDMATGIQLLEARIVYVAKAHAVDAHVVRGMVMHESACDVGAVGEDDHADRGCTQTHIYSTGSVTLSQAIRPALAIPRLAAQVHRLSHAWNMNAAIASWNIGEGGAEWWYNAGEPASGSPSFWPSSAGDMSARATEYVAAVRALGQEKS